MGIVRKKSESSYKKTNRIVVFSGKDLREGINPNPAFDQHIFIKPGKGGGNHKHPRTEWFTGTKSLQIVWQDEVGQNHTEDLGEGIRIEISPFTPHAVINNGSEDALLIEWADGPLVNEVDIQIVEFK